MHFLRDWQRSSALWHYMVLALQHIGLLLLWPFVGEIVDICGWMQLEKCNRYSVFPLTFNSLKQRAWILGIYKLERPSCTLYQCHEQSVVKVWPAADTISTGVDAGRPRPAGRPCAHRRWLSYVTVVPTHSRCWRTMQSVYVFNSSTNSPMQDRESPLVMKDIPPTMLHYQNKKLRCRWQTARRISAICKSAPPYTTSQP